MTDGLHGADSGADARGAEDDAGPEGARPVRAAHTAPAVRAHDADGGRVGVRADRRRPEQGAHAARQRLRYLSRREVVVRPSALYRLFTLLFSTFKIFLF